MNAQCLITRQTLLMCFDAMELPNIIQFLPALEGMFTYKKTVQQALHVTHEMNTSFTTLIIT